MLTTIALLALLLLAVLLLLRPSPAISTPRLIPVSPPPRHVSFSLVSTDTCYALPVQRRWSSPFHKRKPPPSSGVHSPPKLSPLPPAGKRRCSSASYTSTVIHLSHLDVRTPSPPQSPFQRTRFVNPFSRSRTLSPPSSASNYPDTSSPGPSSPSARRRTLVNKLKSIFKSVPPEPNPIIQSKPIFTTLSAKLRRKPVARTQPYGPPWNAPMPVPDLLVSQHKPAQIMSPPLQTSRKCSINRGSRSEITSTSPGQLSPRTFINQLDEKLSLLQQQRVQASISSPHR